MKKALVLLATALSGVSVPAHAAYVFDIQEVGSNVISSGSGSFNITALTLVSTGVASSNIWPNQATVQIGFGLTNEYHGIFGPASFGSGGLAFRSFLSGPSVGLSSFYGDINVPDGYVSGTLLSGSTATYLNQTFASLGLTPGVYSYSWGTGDNADTAIVRIGTNSAVPEPTTWAMMLVGFGAIGFTMRRKQHQKLRVKIC